MYELEGCGASRSVSAIDGGEVERVGGGEPAVSVEAAHFGRWLARRNVLVQLEHKGRFLAALERVQQLDDEILAGSLYRTWGAYYASRGNMEKAVESFEQAARLAPFMLLTRIMCAKECAVPSKDRALFVRQLELALEEKEPENPEILPEFRMERARAKRLLARTDALFPR